jgi:Acetyltransferase (GNAT) domain
MLAGCPARPFSGGLSAIVPLHGIRGRIHGIRDRTRNGSPAGTGGSENFLLMARIGFRPTTLADESAIVALLREAHGAPSPAANSTLEHRHMVWKCWQPHEGWQGSRSYVLTKDDRIVAHGTVVPAVCAWEGERINMLHVIDWAARAEVRGAGAAVMEHIGKLADVIVTSSGSDKGRQLLPFMGFRESSTVVTGYARPIRPWLYFTASGAQRWRRAARYLRACLWALRATSHRDASWQARRISAEEIASTPIPWPAPKYGTAVLERKPAVMSYLLQCPAVAMELYAAGRGGSPEGYFVLAFTRGQARLIDCWLDSESLPGWTALVSLAVRQAEQRPEVGEIVATCSEPLLATALRHCGFHARFSRSLSVRAGSGARVPDRTVRIQMIDDDQAYLHGGFWA